MTETADAPDEFRAELARLRTLERAVTVLNFYERYHVPAACPTCGPDDPAWYNAARADVAEALKGSP